MQKDVIFSQPVPLVKLLKWYVLPRTSRVVPVVLLAALVAGFILAFVKSTQQWLAFVLVINSRFGWIGTLLSCFLWVVPFMPPVFYYSLFKNIPKLWMRTDASRDMKIGVTVGMCVLYPVLAFLLFFMNDKLIAWISMKMRRPEPTAVAAGRLTMNKSRDFLW